MAVSVATRVIKRSTQPPYFREIRVITGDTAYPTGGWVIAASAFTLKAIKHGGLAKIVAGFAAGFAHADLLAQADGSVKLRLRVAAGTEVPDGTNASSVTVQCTVEGY